MTDYLSPKPDRKAPETLTDSAILENLLKDPWIWQVRLSPNRAVVQIWEIAWSPPHRFDDTDNDPADPEQNVSN